MTNTEPKLSPRAAVLWTIAANYNDLVDPIASAGIQGDGASFGLQLTPPTYTTTVREFERLMTVMRNDRHSALISIYDDKGNFIEKASVRKLHWHLLEYHLKATKTMTVPKLTIARAHGRKLHRLPVDEHGAALPKITMRRHPQARIELAAQAVEWQATNWTLDHEPMIPKASYELSIAA